tara:strand:- start:148 stop:642 length:495 start_codon:yes stop_codon:yes gene_type:complete
VKKIILILFGSALLYGCETTGVSYQDVQYSISGSQQAQSQISLGDDRYTVVNLLNARQSSLTAEWLRPADQYMKDGKTMYIHYQRTSHVSDGRNTDDEFTPYVFENNKLVAIGWAHLGGPKVVSSGSSTMGGTVTINDPVRDSQNLMNKGQKMLSGGCTLGINC